MSGLCETCVYSIFCDTWGERKCKKLEKRILANSPYNISCPNYKKRDKNFKEPKCQCEDCLNNAENGD